MYDFRVLRGLCLLILCFIALPAFGQDDPNFEIGLKPYGSYHMGNIDTVSVGNGSLALDIPLISYPQRGGKLKLDFSFHYFNEGMYADQTCYPPPASICYWVPGSTNDLASGIIEKGGVWVSGTAASGLTGAMFQVTEPDGDSHVLGVTATNLLESIDASSYKVTYNPSSGVSTVTDAKGTIYTPTAPTCSSYTPCPSAPREDANGNLIGSGRWPVVSLPEAELYRIGSSIHASKSLFQLRVAGLTRWDVRFRWPPRAPIQANLQVARGHPR